MDIFGKNTVMDTVTGGTASNNVVCLSQRLVAGVMYTVNRTACPLFAASVVCYTVTLFGLVQ